jgi:hypothetical protein
MSDLSPECAPKRTFANASEFMGSGFSVPLMELHFLNGRLRHYNNNRHPKFGKLYS